MNEVFEKIDNILTWTEDTINILSPEDLCKYYDLLIGYLNALDEHEINMKMGKSELKGQADTLEKELFIKFKASGMTVEEAKSRAMTDPEINELRKEVLRLERKELRAKKKRELSQEKFSIIRRRLDLWKKDFTTTELNYRKDLTKF